MEKQIKQNVFGDVTLTWAEPMTLDQVSDLEELLAIWMRGIRRRAEAANSQPQT